jgi:hypothetical protein
MWHTHTHTIQNRFGSNGNGASSVTQQQVAAAAGMSPNMSPNTMQQQQQQGMASMSVGGLSPTTAFYPSSFGTMNTMNPLGGATAMAMPASASGPYGTTLVGLSPYGFQSYMPYAAGYGYAPAAAIDSYTTANALSAGARMNMGMLQQGGGIGLSPIITPGAPIQTTKELVGSSGSNLFVFHIPNDM